MTIRGLGGDVYIGNRKTANCFKGPKQLFFSAITFLLKTENRTTKDCPTDQNKKKSSFRGLSFCLKPETSRNGLN